MSNDLISRKALMECAEYDDKFRLIVPYDKIVKSPTAYDVDSVCKELEKREQNFREYGQKYNDSEGIAAAEACAGDIDIVRNGGKKC